MIIDIIQFVLIVTLATLLFYVGKGKQEELEALERETDFKELTEKEMMGKLRLLTSENERLSTQLLTVSADRDHWRDEAVGLKKDLIRHGAVRG